MLTSDALTNQTEKFLKLWHFITQGRDETWFIKTHFGGDTTKLSPVVQD